MQMFKQILEEGLELQKAQLREQRAHAKEKRQEHQRRHRDELESMENYYKDQVAGAEGQANICRASSKFVVTPCRNPVPTAIPIPVLAVG